MTHISAKRLYDRANQKNEPLSGDELAHLKACAQCLEDFDMFVRELLREERRQRKERMFVGTASRVVSRIN